MAAAATPTAAAPVLLHLLGVGGYQAGEYVVAGVLVAAAAVPVALALRDVPRRAAYVIAVAIVAAAASVPLSEAAPLSRGRLRSELDELRIPDFDVVATGESGHSWCRSTCPTVTRTWRGPAIALRAAVTLALVALRESDLVERTRLGLPDTARVRLFEEDVTITVAAEESGERNVLLTVRLAAVR